MQTTSPFYMRLQLSSLEERITPRAGLLDVSFGNSGRVVTNVNPGYDGITDVAVDRQGRILVVGAENREGLTQNTDDVLLARYTAEGKPDETFGNGGFIRKNIGTGLIGGDNVATRDTAVALLLNQQDRIIVVSSSDSFTYSAILQFDSTGQPDPDFGVGGMARLMGYGSFYPEIHDAVLDEDGRIVLAGRLSTVVSQIQYEKFFVTRLLPNGLIDQSFGTNGYAVADAGLGSFSEARSVRIDHLGRIVLGGYSYPDWGVTYGSNAAFVRFSPDGILDSTFGLNGMATFNISNLEDTIHDIAIDTDNNIVAVGCAGVGRTIRMSVLRLRPDGTLDPTFSSDGKLLISMGTMADAHSVLIDDAGKIVIGGQTGYYLGPAYQFAMVRLNSDGSFDSTFGNGGRVLTSFPQGGAAIAAITFDLTGNIVAGGRSGPPYGGTRFSLARYLSIALADFPRPTPVVTASQLYIEGTEVSDVYTIAWNRNQQLIEVYRYNTLLGQYQTDEVNAIVVRGLTGNDRITVSSALDIPTELYGDQGNDTLIGGAASDLLDGGQGNDYLRGGRGNDTFDGGTGADRLVGESGDDSYVFRDHWETDTIYEVGLGHDTIDLSAVTTDTLFTQSRLLKATSGSNVLTVSGRVESLRAGSGNDTLSALGTATRHWILNQFNSGTLGTLAFQGIEQLLGGSGVDHLTMLPTGQLSGMFDGGRGRNRLDYSTRSTAVRVNLTAETATDLGAVRQVTEVFGGNGEDRIIGNTWANLLVGRGGNDFLVGHAGVDTLNGEAGDDLLLAGMLVWVNDSTKLEQLFAEWNSANDYNTRIAHLTLGGGANGDTTLDATTVLNDGNTVDRVTGDSGHDWLIVHPRDRVLLPEQGETITIL